MKKIIIKNGIISGLIASVFMVCSMAYLYRSEKVEGSMLLGYASMLAAFTFIFIGIKNHRDKNLDGKISFLNAFLIGIGISAIASIMYVAAWGVEYHFFMPDFLEKYTSASIEKLQKSNLSTADLEAKINEINAGKSLYDNILSFSMITFAEIFPVGFLVSIISALILKKK